MKKRTVIIHGHFYQPPRFSPWTGKMKREASAFPANNWNERILYECYKPNTCAEILVDGNVRVVNNYEHISYNIGPTLAGWMIKERIDVYRRIIGADRNTRNAIAQPYNHTILPLDSEMNLQAQIQWGIDEFVLRYGRRPVSMWLPECAVSTRVLEELIKKEMKYVILAGGQAEAVKRLKGYHWYDVSCGNIDVRRPYRCFTNIGFIDVFFSHQGLATDISFNRLLDDPSGLADRIEKLLGKKESEDTLITIATDGETFGHHHKGAEKGLAYLLTRELPGRGINVSNFEDYLENHPVTWEVKIKENSSWSCWHGIERWRGACGCGTEEGSNLDWREPLRKSIVWLGGQVEELVREKTRGLFKTGLQDAINGYGEVLTTGLCAASFRLKYVSDDRRDDPNLDTIMEMLYFSFYSFTSCGWFFGSLVRPEPAQVLAFALRSMELIFELWGINLEDEFYSRLNKHPSVDYVWEKLVKPLRKSPEEIARDCYDIYRYSGISSLTYGFWYVETIEEDGRSTVRMENRRTRKRLEFDARKLPPDPGPSRVPCTDSTDLI